MTSCDPFRGAYQYDNTPKIVPTKTFEFWYWQCTMTIGIVASWLVGPFHGFGPELELMTSRPALCYDLLFRPHEVIVRPTRNGKQVWQGIPNIPTRIQSPFI